MKGIILNYFILLLCLFVPNFAGKSTKYFKSATPPGEEPVCGYDSCPKLNPEAEYHIHLVPHRLNLFFSELESF